jgi:hypothetical protein
VLMVTCGVEEQASTAACIEVRQLVRQDGGSRLFLRNIGAYVSYGSTQPRVPTPSKITRRLKEDTEKVFEESSYA